MSYMLPKTNKNHEATNLGCLQPMKQTQNVLDGPSCPNNSIPARFELPQKLITHETESIQVLISHNLLLM